MWLEGARPGHPSFHERSGSGLANPHVAYSNDILPVRRAPMKRKHIPPGPGQESVWDYPRPPRLEPCLRRIRVEFGGVVIADSTRAYRVLETSHPPVYYTPLEDVRAEYVVASQSRPTFCEWKGRAVYHTLSVDG